MDHLLGMRRNGTQAAMTDDERKVVEGWSDKWPLPVHFGWKPFFLWAWADKKRPDLAPVVILTRAHYESLLADQARFAICMSHGFPVRNQTAQTLDRMWTIGGRYWGATTLECIDNALAPELPPAPGVER
jgi:hypothetical protein